MITTYKSTGLLMLMTIVVLLSSCDPLHVIEFVNESEEEVSVYIQVDTSMEFLALEEIRNGDAIALKVASNTSEIIDFGMGTWSDYELNQVSKVLKRIEIKTGQKVKSYQGQMGLMEAFRRHLKGGWQKTVIEFKIE